MKCGDGFWVNDEHTGVQLYAKPELMRPREFTKANWCPIPSPAYPPGPIVLQVIA